MPGATDPSHEPLLGASSSSEPSPYGTGNGVRNQHTSKKPADVLQEHHDDHATKLVHFTPGDPEDPRNWPRWRKWLMIGPIILIDLSVSWGASGFSPASKQFADEFRLPPGMGTLGLSSYILGLAFGPMTLAPLSEVRSVLFLFFVFFLFFL